LKLKREPKARVAQTGQLEDKSVSDLCKRDCGKNHSAHGGRKAHPGFELKSGPKGRRRRRASLLDFKIRMRSGQPCDEWGGAAGAAALV
jgi:hypothetical protein